MIGFAEAFAAVEAAWSLQRSDMRVLAFARPGSKPALRHVRGVKVVTVPAPEAGVDRTVAAVSRLVTQFRPDAFLPLDDASLWLSRRVELGGCCAVGPGQDGVDLALNKSAQLELARTVGFSVPQTGVFSSISETKVLSWPAVIKPADAVRLDDQNRLTRPGGGVCANETELDRLRAKAGTGTILVQPLIVGTGEGLFGYTSASQPTCFSAHRRVRMANPQGSASSACASRDVDSQLHAAAMDFLRQSGWNGLFMFEFLRDEAGTAWFMELNGRAWGSLALARRRGYEYPSWAVQDALGLPRSPATPINPPDIVARHAGRELTHLAYVMRGPQSKGITRWPGRSDALREVLRVSRRDRWYNWDRHQSSVLLADTWRTVIDLAGRTRGNKR